MNDVDFDHETIRLLRYLKHHPSADIDTIRRRFDKDGDDVSPTLISLCQCGYLVSKREDGTFTMHTDGYPISTSYTDVFWVSPKGKKILDDRLF